MAIDMEGGIIKNVRVVFYQTHGLTLQFLVTKESGGKLALPGGCKDEGDPDLMTAMKRELREELGLTQESYDLEEVGVEQGYKKLYTDPTSERFGRDVTFSIFLARYNGREVICPSDGVLDIAWLSCEQAHEALTSDHTKKLFISGVRTLAMRMGAAN